MGDVYDAAPPGWMSGPSYQKSLNYRVKELEVNQLALEKKLKELGESLLALETRLAVIEGKLATQNRLGPRTTEFRSEDQIEIDRILNSMKNKEDE